MNDEIKPSGSQDQKSASKTAWKAARAPIKKAEEYWHVLGPGLTTGASDDDPSGIATYSQAGAQYGFGFLWTAAWTFPLMAVVQEMCARIGLVTGEGLAANIRKYYPRWVLYLCAALLFFANTFNIGADLGAMADGVRLIFPGASFSLLIVVFVVVSLALQIFTSYKKYARYLKWLALFLVAYIFSALSVKLDWGEILNKGIFPSAFFTKDQIFLLCGILGTTISPYLFFWQTSQEVEEEILSGKATLQDRQGTTPEDAKRMRIDVWSGMLLSNLVTFFIIAACGATLYVAGITNIGTAADAAQALRPFAGEWAYLLFALGIVSTGLLGVPVLAGSASYAISESFEIQFGLYKKFREAYFFYGVIIASMLAGLAMNFLGFDPIRALLYAAVINGIIAPVILVLIVLISSNRAIMGEWANRRFVTAIGWFTAVGMAIVGVAVLAGLFI